MNPVLSKNNSEFMLAALQKGLRVDGRAVSDPRPVRITFGLESGSVEVQLGGTRVLAGVLGELVKPPAFRMSSGTLKFSLNFPTWLKRSPEEVDDMLRVIERGIGDSNAVDVESLCVLMGERVWQIHVDLSVIQDCGNVVDCANLAAMAALMHHRRPDVTVVGSKITVHSIVDRFPIGLAINHVPICVTLGHVISPMAAHPSLDFTQSSKSSATKKSKTKTKTKTLLSEESSSSALLTVVDPSSEEQLLMDGKSVFCLTQHSQLCAIDKVGGVPLSSAQIVKFAEKLAMPTVRNWHSLLETELAKARVDDPRRRKQLLSARETNPLSVFEPLVFKAGTGPTLEPRKTADEEKAQGELRKEAEVMWQQFVADERSRFSALKKSLPKVQTFEKKISAHKSVVVSEFV